MNLKLGVVSRPIHLRKNVRDEGDSLEIDAGPCGFNFPIVHKFLRWFDIPETENPDKVG